ncbi:MAG: cysteine--tRNA ligase [Actinobacteria bacterium]|nr:MAG: cysteine--tRNA ligase [Actinomycetota bacterium]
MKVYNTLSQNKEELTPLSDKEIKMYVCGPTVYGYIHIGNARAYIAFDVIYRWLKHKGFDVTYVRNLTDVDDKIINRAKEENTTAGDIAKKYIEAFHNDMDVLGVLPPDIEPTATETIPKMLEIIEGLIDKGLAYEADGDVFYRVRSFKDYGKLSKRSIDELEAGARVEVDERKEDPLDFALWKKAKEGEPAWDSLWGKGRPGWHLECSAMSLQYLKRETIDIHGGGHDLIFPHHENEIAQSEGYTGKPFVKYWLHNGFVNIKKEKMAKSVGNIVTIKELEERYKDRLNDLRNSFRMLFLKTHYRSPIDFDDELLTEAEASGDGISEIYKRIAFIIDEAPDINEDKSVELEELSSKLEQTFTSAMDDDFNSSVAISLIFDFIRDLNIFLDDNTNLSRATKGALVNSRNLINKLLLLLGFNFPIEIKLNLPPKIANTYEEFAKKKALGDVDKMLQELLEIRDKAKANKEFSKADQIRDELNAIGIKIEDTPLGPVASPSPEPNYEDE